MVEDKRSVTVNKHSMKALETERTSQPSPMPLKKSALIAANTRIPLSILKVREAVEVSQSLRRD
jgi:hypothetical protein